MKKTTILTLGLCSVLLCVGMATQAHEHGGGGGEHHGGGGFEHHGGFEHGGGFEHHGGFEHGGGFEHHGGFEHGGGFQHGGGFTHGGGFEHHHDHDVHFRANGGFGYVGFYDDDDFYNQYQDLGYPCTVYDPDVDEYVVDTCY